MPSTNHAALLTAKEIPLEVLSASYPTTSPDDILIRTSAVDINPHDHGIQTVPNFIVPHLKLPFPFGTDVAGTVISVGSRVTRFKPGDRVVGCTLGMLKTINRAVETAFQEYMILHPHMASLIPDELSFERAAVLPLGLTTAACALFLKEHLNLPHLRIDPTPTGKTLLVWGGSTSVGCNVIQFAVAAGYDVVSTASTKNHELLRKLGAVEVFDYQSQTVVKDIVEVFKNRVCEVFGNPQRDKGREVHCQDLAGYTSIS